MEEYDTRTLCLTIEERLALAALDREVRDLDGSNDAEHDAAFDLVTLFAKALAPPIPDIYGVRWRVRDIRSLCVICGQLKKTGCDHAPRKASGEREPEKTT